ncbi:MAG: adenylate/guanylate cyclase domain-containing protein [Planctomycetes bacterium]|nr:adenylate/guanylate cyclase domain-containing protein [Planctomycetota bacterium]
MAELQARFENPDTRTQSLWRYTLPEGRNVTIGRLSLAALDVPAWNRSEWVVDDPRISGQHVIIHWSGKKLRVQRRKEPADRPAINPVFYKAKPSDDFEIDAGESFTVGSTTFTVLLPQDDSESGMTHTMTRGELRHNPFANSQRPLIALAELPEIIRVIREDSQLEDRVLDVILKGLPLAEFASFAQIDPRGGPTARAAITRCKQRAAKEESIHISTRLVRQVRESMESVLYVWDKKLSDSNLSMSVIPGTDWAICTPLEEKSNLHRAIYVAGRTPKNILSETQLKNDSEFQDYHKFVNLAAELFSSMREMRRTENQNSRLRQYLPKRIVSMLEHQDLDEKLKPRIAEVTALFCDLRGSCQNAEETGDMFSSWKRMSSALDIMTSAIHDNEGVIGGLQGDAAVGFWGWPNSKVEQIDSAVRAVLNIRRAFARDRKLKESHFNCGIGLAHGAAVVGRLGTYDSFKLDAYGPIMNLSSRLESLTKHFGVEILVDDAVANRLKTVDPDSSRCRLRSLGKIQPAGMTVKVLIHEILPPIEEADADETQLPYGVWEAAVKTFMEGNWVRSRDRFEKFLRSVTPENLATEKASKVFLEYMDRYDNKPPENWDGTIVMQTK